MIELIREFDEERLKYFEDNMVHGDWFGLDIFGTPDTFFS